MAQSFKHLIANRMNVDKSNVKNDNVQLNAIKVELLCGAAARQVSRRCLRVGSRDGDDVRSKTTIKTNKEIIIQISIEKSRVE